MFIRLTKKITPTKNPDFFKILGVIKEEGHSDVLCNVIVPYENIPALFNDLKAIEEEGRKGKQ